MSRMKQVLITVLFIDIIANIAIASNWKEDAKAIDISGGEDHTLVLTLNKWPWVCGDNYWRQLGIGNDQDQKALVHVEDGNMVTISGHLEDINDVDAGWKHSLALESYDPCDPNCRGYVWAWGDNDKGELGDNGHNPYEATPVRVLRGEQTPTDPNDPNLARIVDISAGRSGEHSLAVDVNGYAYAWGYNKYGQCGNDVSGDGEKEWTPVHVRQGQQPNDPCDPNNWLKHIIAVSAGEWHSMALESYDPCDPNWGRVYTWGNDGFVLNNGAGVLGIGDSAGDRDTPVCVRCGEQDYNEPNQIYLKHIVAISAGWDHSMALEKYDEPDPLEKWADPNGNGGVDPNHKGRVYTWGNNGQGWGDDGDEHKSNGGRLGDGTTDNSSLPVIVLSGEQYGDDPNHPHLECIIAISAGEAHSMALDIEGNVYCWGDNQHGQLGDGSTDQNLAPVRVVGEDKNRNGIHDANEGYLENIVAISAGYWHSLAIDANGVIWTWGKGNEGRLALGHKTIDCNIPHRIPVVYNLTQETFAFAVQTAINDANDSGDTLEASRGTYYEDVDFYTKTIILRSTDPNNPAVVEDTVIQGSGGAYVPAVEFTDNSNSILDGFTITNNDYGIKCDSSSPTITNSIIASCAGHGLYCLDNSTVEIKNCTISGNGGSASPVEDGISCTTSEIILSNCLIAENAGSGIYSYQSTSTIDKCIIADNDRDGIYFNDTSGQITRCIVRDNGSNSSMKYHGIRCDDAYTEAIRIMNNWVYGNGSGASGSGVYLISSWVELEDVTIRHNTIVNNAGYGIETDGIPDINNCVIWGNDSDSLQYGDYNVTYSCIEGGYDGATNISSDPCFVDADANDYHLAADSPCIDTGDPYFEPDANETDIDGNVRLIGEYVDMGADEFWPSDFNMDGIVNFIDYAMLVGKFGTDPNDPNYNDDFDIEDNNSIDFGDVKVLCQNWLLNAELWSGSMLLMGGPGMEGMNQMVPLQAAPYEVAIAEENPAITEPVDYEYLLDWLAQIWLDPEVQERIDAEAWLRVYRSLEKEAEKLSR